MSARQQEVDDLLRIVARAIPDNATTGRLGKVMGFSEPDIKTFIIADTKEWYASIKHPGCNHQDVHGGTLRMLRQWSQSHGFAWDLVTIQPALRQALIAAKLDWIADKHLPEASIVAGVEAPGHSHNVVPRNNADNVTPLHIKRLARLVPPGKYTDLCSMLGVEYGQAQQKLAKFSNDYAQALSDVLHSWVDAKVRSKAELKVALEGAELGGVYARVCFE